MKKTQTLEAETTQKGMTALDKFEAEYPELKKYKEASEGDKELAEALEKEMRGLTLREWNKKISKILEQEYKRYISEVKE